MALTTQRLMAMIIFGCAYILVFVLAKVMRRVLPQNKEISRKTSHFLGGIVSVFLPFGLNDNWLVFFFCLGFLLLLVITKQFEHFQEIHDVERSSWGAYLFPVAVCLIYFLAQGKPWLYVTSILVLTVSDSAAALLGKRYGSVKITVEGNLKSLEGSVAFGLFTFLCVHLVLLFMTDMNKVQIVLIALVIALVVTGFELISLNGTDNLFIPLGTFYIIDRMSKFDTQIHLDTMIQLAASLAIVFIIFFKNRHLSFGWKVTFALFLFAVWALCGHWWIVPTLIFLGIVWGILHFFIKKPNKKLDVKAALSLGIMPVLPAFASAFADNLIFFYPAYLSILWLEIVLVMSELYLVHDTPPLKVIARKKETARTRNLKTKVGNTHSQEKASPIVPSNLDLLTPDFLKAMFPFALLALLILLAPAISFFQEGQAGLLLLTSVAGLPLAILCYLLLKITMHKSHHLIGRWLHLKSRELALITGCCVSTALAWIIKFY